MLSLEVGVTIVIAFVPSPSRTEMSWMHLLDIGYLSMGPSKRYLITIPSLIFKLTGVVLLAYHYTDSFEWVRRVQAELNCLQTYLPHQALPLSFGRMVKYVAFYVFIEFLLVGSFLLFGTLRHIPFHPVFVVFWAHITLVHCLIMYILVVSVCNFYLFYILGQYYFSLVEVYFRQWVLVAKSRRLVSMFHIASKLDVEFTRLYLISYQFIQYQKTIYIVLTVGVLLITLPLYSIMVIFKTSMFEVMRAFFSIFLVNSFVVVLTQHSGNIDRRAKGFADWIYFHLFVLNTRILPHKAVSQVQRNLMYAVKMHIEQYFLTTERQYIGINVLGNSIDMSFIINVSTTLTGSSTLMFSLVLHNLLYSHLLDDGKH